MRLEYEIALECFLWGLDMLTRRDLGLIFTGYRDVQSEQHIEQLIDRLRQQKMIEQSGRGPSAEIKITDAGRHRVRVRRPADHWDRPWDGHWRVFLFDLPARQQKDRVVLWRALREARFGLLQRSVWIWPFEVEPELRQVLQTRGSPGAACGFEVSRLFLCEATEVVASSWNFVAIGRAHETYLKHLVANVTSLNRADNLSELARVARVERDAYQDAFAIDPLLPRPLWPKSYKGTGVEQRHQVFMARLRTRVAELSGV